MIDHIENAGMFENYKSKENSIDSIDSKSASPDIGTCTLVACDAANMTLCLSGASTCSVSV